MSLFFSFFSPPFSLLVTTNCDDNCPELPNPYQEDSDGDLFGDACDDYLAMGGGGMGMMLEGEGEGDLTAGNELDMWLTQPEPTLVPTHRCGRRT